MEYFKRLGNFWFPDWMAVVWLLFALPALYFFQTTVHEGSHAMAALFATGSFPKVAPFPHLNTDMGFLNGVTIGSSDSYVTVIGRTECDSDARRSHTVLAGFPAAPQFVDLALIVLFSVLTGITTFTNPMVRFPLRAWYLGAAIDFMYNTARGLIGGCNKGTDWSKFLLGSDMSSGVFALLTWIFWLGILSHFAWVYWSGWGRHEVPKTGFWDYRWVALILGILSFFALVLSAAVSDPSIDKSSAAFIVPLIFQMAAFVWYWIYFTLTFKFKR